MIRLPFTALFTLISAGACALVACGSLSDPSKEPLTGTTVAKLTGSLTGTSVPDGTHVALVWRTGQTGVAVGADVEVVDGNFTMDLAAPPAGYLIAAPDGDDDDDPSSTTFPSTGGSAGTNAPTSGTSPSTQSLHPLDVVSGTTISQPLTVAWAGFIVYQDTNGNGKLDLNDAAASTSDKVLGGANDLTLTFYAGGSSLDYEKLRDHSGILPHVGYNLSWSTESRWLALDLVELKLEDDMSLPESVCAGTPTSSTVSVENADASVTYPSAGDPNLQCSDDGYSWTWNVPSSSSCTTTVTTPGNLCVGTAPATETCVGSGPSSGSIGPGDDVPSWWPCPIGVTATADASVPTQPTDGGATTTSADASANP